MKAARNCLSNFLKGAGWRLLAIILIAGQQAATLCHAGNSVVAWGANNALQTQVPPGLTNTLMVAGGDSHSLALKSDGTVVGWGFNLFGQATPPAGLSNVISIAAGSQYSMALTTNGTVAVWGRQPAAPAGLSTVIGIAAGWDHCVALKGNGTVTAWGDNTFGQTNVPAWLTNVTALAAGNGNTLALLANNTVVSWGDNSFSKTNVPIGLTNVVAVAAGEDHCLALRRDGSIIAWGDNRLGQAIVPGTLTNAVAIAAGIGHSLALRADTTLAAWGDNTYGQSTVNPTQNGFITVAAGGYHSLAVQSDGSPVILSQPANQSVIISKSGSFQVIAAGTQPLAYQWRHNGANIPGANGSVLSVSNVQPSDAGSYSAVVSNVKGSITSSNAILTALTSPPWIISPPQNLTTNCGDTASFKVTADGPPPYSYQWLYQGSAVAAATQSTLVVTNTLPSQAGNYAAVVTNIYGAVTSDVASLTVNVDSSIITSALTASGRQGTTFTYTIAGRHSPNRFAASPLPLGLSINPTNGVISGTNLENGVFGINIVAYNACTSDSKILVLTISSAVPAITSALTAIGTEGAAFVYRIRGNNTPTSFGAQALPLGLSLNPTTGNITGNPVYPGDYFSTISASNVWGVGSATLHITVGNAPITGLSIAIVTNIYSSPYLLDFQFTLRNDNDPTIGIPITVDPKLLTVSCMENDTQLSPETSFFLSSTILSQVSKTYLVLDFTESIASLANGDSNNDGISDAVDNVVLGAQTFVNAQPADAQIGVYEFHRDDMNPQKVMGLTTDKTALNTAIGGIWTNYVQNFPAGSRCWDALVAAITNLGPAKVGEQHNVVFVSDGVDESSFNTVSDVTNTAVSKGVRIYCVGFGDLLDTNVLQSITTATGGSYYTAPNAASLASQFALISKELQANYLLRWATLKRSSTPFQPSFAITYQGLTATSYTVDPNSGTNYVVPTYIPTQHTGTVTDGALSLVANAQDSPKSITLRANYTPRYIRQMLVHYRANWPCVAAIQSTNTGQMLYGWSLSETNDGLGGKLLTLSSSNTLNLATSIPFCAQGSLVTFSLRDMLTASNAFSVFTNDNTLYTNTGGQRLLLAATNVNPFITFFTNLPFATPIPWLVAHGFTNNNLAAVETNDPDADGIPTWKEYQANTDPRDSNSLFVVRSFVRAVDGRYQISFSTSTNRTYRVLSSTNLANWQTFQDFIPGINADVTLTDTRYQPGVTSLYYRVQAY